MVGLVLLGTLKNNKTFTSNTLGDLPQLVSDLRPHIQHKLLLIIGDLGAGKTTFVKELVVQLGSSDVASSPSYAIINKYAAPTTIYHIDLYRLDSTEDVFHLGIEELLYGDNICLIEWPQIIINQIDPPYHILKIDVNLEGKRQFTLTQVVQD